MNSARLDSLWTQVEGWLAAHAPGDHQTLLPGLSGREVARLEAGLGFPIHGDLLTFLGLRGGCRQPESSMEPGAFFFGYTLLDVDAILAAHRQLVDMVDDSVEGGYGDSVIGSIAHPSWVPIAQDVTGDLVFVDHREGLGGAVGMLSFGDPQPTWPWSSMTLMAEDMLSSLRSGSGLAAVHGLTPRVHEERMLQWEIEV
ncbi:SMI1/KNR4 family protein [Streptomyces sp. NPDC006173]|uniref:SMI1/KNR4 family protein n=1 Tax=Streptomyces sp. NPDC006173 TaxID=3155349 RepID=UPI0034057440